MAVLENSIQISAPKDKVWGAIADLDVYAQWMTLHVDFPEGTPDEMKQGESFKEKVKIMGMPGDVTWTVAEYTEGDLIELSGQGPMGTTLSASFKVDGSDEETSVSYSSEFGGAALAPLAATLEKEAAKAGQESLEKLRALVTGEPVPAG
ncbi:MAG: SRPBCC family protein [Actinobacteria bacterium]|nr:MAG: SRPBCC family protein [Actinomycetota bacterium]